MTLRITTLHFYFTFLLQIPVFFALVSANHQCYDAKLKGMICFYKMEYLYIFSSDGAQEVQNSVLSFVRPFGVIVQFMCYKGSEGCC